MTSERERGFGRLSIRRGRRRKWSNLNACRRASVAVNIARQGRRFVLKDLSYNRPRSGAAAGFSASLLKHCNSMILARSYGFQSRRPRLGARASDSGLLPVLDPGSEWRLPSSIWFDNQRGRSACRRLLDCRQSHSFIDVWDSWSNIIRALCSFFAPERAALFWRKL